MSQTPPNAPSQITHVDTPVESTMVEPRESTTVLSVLQHIAGFSRAQALIELSRGVTIDGKKYFTNEAIEITVGTNIIVDESKLVVIRAHVRNLKRLDHGQADYEQSM